MCETVQHNPVFTFSSSRCTAFKCVTTGGAAFSMYSSRDGQQGFFLGLLLHYLLRSGYTLSK